VSAGLGGEAAAGLSLEGGANSAGGASPVPPGAGTLSVDSIAHGGITLPSILTAGLQAGTFAFVGAVLSVGDWFYLVRGQGLTADGITVVNSGSEVGAQWVRANIPSQIWLASATVAKFWVIDPVGGNDENRGCGATLAAARLVPLKTQAELNRRFSGAVNIAPTIEIAGNIPNADDIGFPNLVTKTRDVLPLVQGRIDPVGGPVNPPIFSGAITGYVTANPATNTPFQMTIASLPVSWTASGLLGLMVQKADGTKTSHVLADLGAKTARIMQPRTSTGTGAAGVTTDFVVGETVNVYRLFSIPQWPYGQNVLFPKAGNLEIKGLRASGGIAQNNLAGSNPTVSNCKLSGVGWQGGQQGLLGQVLCSGQNSFSGFSELTIQGVAVVGGITIFGGNSAADVLDGTLQVDGATARVDLFDQTLLSVASGGILAVFDCATFAFDMATLSSLWSRGGGMYGAGNTSTLMSIDAGSRCRMSAASTAATTGAQINLAGAALAFAAIPVIDVPNQCGVSG